MKWHIPSLIEKKRDGGEHSSEEIRALVTGFLNGTVSEAQMSAWAMAVYFSDLTSQETVALTTALRDSGSVFDWPKGTPIKVDKHSTGGVGDKVSLVLAPLLACDGLWVPMISGRGLGLTGGTLDKLESIPGFRTTLTFAEGLRQLESVGAFLAGASADFCPGDKKLYALRDVTGTVPARALIVASILSKKLAESLDRLVLDVKFGSGAFMKTQGQAETLARHLHQVSEMHGVRTAVKLSSMNEPLGRTAGNALEVIEAVETLQNRGPEDLRELTLDLAVEVSNASRETLAGWLRDGSAWSRFVRLVEWQGGDARSLERLGEVQAAPVRRWATASTAGRVAAFDAGMVGSVVVRLGGGRNQPTDSIDPTVGVSAMVKVGDYLEGGQPFCRIHARDEASADAAESTLRQALRLGHPEDTPARPGE